MSQLEKLALGTVQFGLPYGIASKVQTAVEYQEVTQIISSALSHNITVLDTAQAYGNSEEVLGTYIREYTPQVELVSKMQAHSRQEAELVFARSLEKLGVKQLYGYLLHRFAQYEESPEIFDVLLEQKKALKVRKIGFSLYYPYELEKIFQDKIPFDLVQVPYSLFDRRFEPYFAHLKELGVEVHVRSVFLQGLLLRDPVLLPSFFDPIKPVIMQLGAVAKKNGASVHALALLFALTNPYVDKVVVGVHTHLQLQNLIQIASGVELSGLQLQQLEVFSQTNEDMLVPMRWPT